MINCMKYQKAEEKHWERERKMKHEKYRKSQRTTKNNFTSAFFLHCLYHQIFVRVLMTCRTSEMR